MSNTLSIKDSRFGVLGQGDDETEKILRVCAYAQREGFGLFWPAGLYRTSKPIPIARPQVVHSGEAIGVTTGEQITEGLGFFDWQPSTTSNDDYGCISGMRIKCAGGDSACLNVVSNAGYNVDGLILRDLELLNAKYGVYGDGLANASMENVSFTNLDTGILTKGNANEIYIRGAWSNCRIGGQFESGKGVTIDCMDITGAAMEYGFKFLGAYDGWIRGANCEVSSDNFTFLFMSDARRTVTLSKCSMVSNGGEHPGMIAGNVGYGGELILDACRFQADPGTSVEDPNRGDHVIARNRADTYVINRDGDNVRVRVLENDGETVHLRYAANEIRTNTTSLGTAGPDNWGQLRRAVYASGSEQIARCRLVAPDTYDWIDA